MCVSHGKALEKTNVRVSIKHQHSLEKWTYKVHDMSFPHTQQANGYTSLQKSQITTKLVTTHGEDRKRKPHQDEGYQLDGKPCQDKHEENDLHHTRVQQDATR